MSPGLLARPDGMFSQAGTMPITLTFGFSSASVERDAFAHQHVRRGAFAAALVFENDQPCGLVRTACDRQKRTHTEFLDLLVFEHFDAEFEFLGEFPGLIAEETWRADIAGQVAEALG